MPTTDTEPALKTCRNCCGSGTCSYCQGAGQVTRLVRISVSGEGSALQAQEVRCQVCGGAGICKRCVGTGLVGAAVSPDQQPPKRAGRLWSWLTRQR
jgi:DnaJ-class molecular chaperone